MWPFTEREQYRPSEAARALIRKVPIEFGDDGLSCFPDSLWGFDFKWAGRLHDWGYCSRCHPAGSLTVRTKKMRDKMIGQHVAESLPLRWKWVGHAVRYALWRAGYGSFDSCGFVPHGATDEQLVAGLCRHGMRRPDWMDRT